MNTKEFHLMVCGLCLGMMFGFLQLREPYHALQSGLLAILFYSMWRWMP